MAKPWLIFIMILSVIIKLRPILGETRVTCPALPQHGGRIRTSICTGKSSLNCPAYNTGPVAGSRKLSKLIQILKPTTTTALTNYCLSGWLTD